MSTIQAWQLLLVTLAGWINRHQQDVIEYIQEENRILRKKLKGKRIRFTDDERRRLAVKGKALGRSVLNQVASIVTPDTILRWSSPQRPFAGAGLEDTFQTPNANLDRFRVGIGRSGLP